MIQLLGEKPAAKTLLFVALSLLLFSTMHMSWAPQLLDVMEVNNLIVHQSVELLSIYITMSVVMVSFLRMDGQSSMLQNKIIFGFTLVALLDYVHAVSYAGMPAFLSPSSTAKSIFFWLASRTSELVTLVSVCFVFWFRGSKVLWFGLALLLSAVFVWLGSYHLEWFPQTFVPGQGVTEFKSRYEYLLGTGHMIVASVCFMLARTGKEPLYKYFAAAAYFMGLCSFSLSSYSSPTEYSLFLGHIFKLMAAVAMFRGIVLSEIARPYRLLKQAEQATSSQKEQIKSILNSLPVGVVRLDKHLKYEFLNQQMLALRVAESPALIGKKMETEVPSELQSMLTDSMQRVLNERQSVEFAFAHRTPDGKQVYRDVVAVPELNENGDVHHILCLVTDITERVRADLTNFAALREIEELRHALDEHAIVAVTDLHGTITSVNDKFCQISQYSREELLGKNHRVINSGVHSQSFFKELWQTIKAGKIWHGEVCNRAKDGSLYWVNTTIVPYLNERGKPKQFLAIRADVTKRKLAEQEAQRLAQFDELTGLPNKKFLHEKFAQLQQQNSEQSQLFAVLMIDLDNFKVINDSLGYETGDQLLKLTAERLRNLTSVTDLVARFGGDEFVVLMTQLPEDPQLAMVAVQKKAELLRAELAKPISLDHHVMTSTPSMGVSLFDAGSDTSDILIQAESAMYKAKEAGRNRVSFFDANLQVQLNRRNEMLSLLMGALERDEFSAFAQPICNAAGELTGAEMLMRWFSPVLGSISPVVFIPLAEQSNLICRLGDWMLQQGGQLLAQWAKSEHSQHWTVAVNVSALQFNDAGFVDSVLQTIRHYQINPRLLHLEVTESLMQSSLDHTISVISSLQQLGVRFSMDDFGTGYSSLSYLTKLPIHILKIDSSFIRAMLHSVQDQAVVRTIVALASSLKLDVVAEGVEPEEQRNFLQKLGCQYYQGYYFGKPMPTADLTRMYSPLPVS